MIGKIFRAVWECFCGKSKSSKDKKQDTFQSNDNLDDMEAGGKGEEDWGDDFESWDNKPVAPQIVPKPLQKLDDFDGMAAPPKENKADDVDFFGGMTPSYVAPKQVDVSRDKNKPKAPMLGLDDDVDIDMDSWESGNARKHKKKGLGGTKI